MNRIDIETTASATLAELVRQQLAVPKNRRKGIPTEDVPQLLRMAADEIDEALHAHRCGLGLAAVLAEIGDAGAFLAMAAWRAGRG
jgi:hypothetical protein